MLPNLVTLCLLITYHWHGSKADSTWARSSMSGSVRSGIAGEVNGSSTYARLNVPVVKRSSNQGAFANELRPPIVVERAVDPMPPNLFVAPRREYPNRNREKYITKNFFPTKKFGEPLSTKILPIATNHEIKSSILKKIAFVTLPNVRLIGKTNFSRIMVNPSRWLRCYEESGALGKFGNTRIDVETIKKNGEDESMKKLCEKLIQKNFRTYKSNVDDVFVTDYVNSKSEKVDENYSIFEIGTNDDEMLKNKRQKRSALRPVPRGSFERSANGFNGEFNRFVGYKRLHQQSRNTEPQTIIQHQRRNTKRHTVYDNNKFSQIANFVGNKRGMDGRPIVDSSSPIVDRNDKLRFVPADRMRNENRIYFQRILKPLQSVGTFGNEDTRPIDGSLRLDDRTNPSEITKFDDEQIATLKNSIKGVFDKYETRQREQTDLLPNVRMIQPERIFLTTPRLIYDSKILPAGVTFDPYFQYPSNVPVNHDDNENSAKNVNNVFLDNDFHRSHEEAEVDHTRVIPVREDGPSYVENAKNFVTPAPNREITDVDEVSERVKRPNSKTNVGYVISGDTENPGSTESKNASQRDVTHEVSPVNHESTVDAGFHSHFGGNNVPDVRELSYDDSVGITDDHGQSGSTDVNHSSVIDGTNDEYAITSTEPRGKTRSYVATSDNWYDNGSYKWRDNNERSRYAANYSFDYRVSDRETENEFGHQETRKEGITNGRYHVRLPDGRLQKVNYHVDDGGYHASVTYHDRDNDE